MECIINTLFSGSVAKDNEFTLTISSIAVFYDSSISNKIQELERDLFTSYF